jgi:hypothetical protein
METEITNLIIEFSDDFGTLNDSIMIIMYLIENGIDGESIRI